MRDLLLISFVMICSVIALRRPVFGLLTFICLGFLNPQSMLWTVGRTFPLSQLAGAGTILGYVFWSEPKKFPRKLELFVIFALWAMFGISTLFAIAPERATERFINVSKILVMVIMATALINTPHRLHLLIRVIALSLGFYGLKGGVFVLVSGGSYIVFGPEGSFLEANNSIGLALVMNMPLLVYLLRTETKSWLRWLIKLMVVFSYPAVVCTYSRGAWIGLALVTLLVVLKSQRRRLLVILIAISVAVMLPFVSQILPERLVDRYDTLINYQDESSAQSRFWNWEFCKRVGMAHPIAGGGFEFYSLSAYATYYPEFLDRWPGKVWSCHSAWLTVFAEHGLPGFVLWITLIAMTFRSLSSIRTFARAHQDIEWVGKMSDMIAQSLLAFMVVASFLDAAYFDMFYYLVGVVMIVRGLVESDRITGPITTAPEWLAQPVIG